MTSKTSVRELYKQFKQEFDAGIEMAFLLQDWEDAYNVGGMFRVADAAGAKQMVLTGRTPTPPDPMLHVTSMGHHRRIPWTHQTSSEDAALKLKAQGYRMIAIELAEGAVPYMDLDWPDRFALVLGNEVNGVYTNVMKHCDDAVFIPQLGKGRSMNVHVSAAIVAFHALMVGGPNQREEEAKA